MQKGVFLVYPYTNPTYGVIMLPFLKKDILMGSIKAFLYYLWMSGNIRYNYSGKKIYAIGTLYQYTKCQQDFTVKGGLTTV